MEEMGISVIGSFTFDVGDVYPEETGKKGAYFSLKSPNLPNYARLIGYWANYKIEEFSVTQFSVSKKIEKEKRKPVFTLEVRVNPKDNPPFSTSTEKIFPQKNDLEYFKKFKNYKINLYSVGFISIFIIIFISKNSSTS
jgi:hypothetical protein